jgi:hypothetical protein
MSTKTPFLDDMSKHAPAEAEKSDHYIHTIRIWKYVFERDGILREIFFL